MDWTKSKVQIRNYEITTSLHFIMENVVRQYNWNFSFQCKNSIGHNKFSFKHIKNYKKCLHIIILQEKEIDYDC